MNTQIEWERLYVGSGNKSDFKRLTKPSGNNVEATYEGCVKLTTVVEGARRQDSFYIFV